MEATAHTHTGPRPRGPLANGVRFRKSMHLFPASREVLSVRARSNNGGRERERKRGTYEERLPNEIYSTEQQMRSFRESGHRHSARNARGGENHPGRFSRYAMATNHLRSPVFSSLLLSFLPLRETCSRDYRVLISPGASLSRALLSPVPALSFSFSPSPSPSLYVFRYTRRRRFICEIYRANGGREREKDP